MRRSVPWLLAPLALMWVLGCPLDIQVRPEEAPDAGCPDGVCPCMRDTDCPEEQRCGDFYDKCEPGPRLTEECSGIGSCPSFAHCEDNRCQLSCTYGCPLGYQCAPESFCVEACTAGPPETLGNACDSSMDCLRCGFCVGSSGAKRCHQPCRFDADCPGSEPGACQPVPGSSLRACRLPP